MLHHDLDQLSLTFTGFQDPPAMPRSRHGLARERYLTERRARLAAEARERRRQITAARVARAGSWLRRLATVPALAIEAIRLRRRAAGR